MSVEDPLHDLALKAYPGARVEVELDHRTALVWRDGVPVLRITNHDRAREGLIAALSAMIAP